MTEIQSVDEKMRAMGWREPSVCCVSNYLFNIVGTVPNTLEEMQAAEEGGSFPYVPGEKQAMERQRCTGSHTSTFHQTTSTLKTAFQALKVQ